MRTLFLMLPPVTLTGLAAWYGLLISGRLGGVASLMSSDIKAAAFVFAGDGVRSPGDGGEACPHAIWRRGDGRTGVDG